MDFTDFLAALTDDAAKARPVVLSYARRPAPSGLTREASA